MTTSHNLFWYFFLIPIAAILFICYYFGIMEWKDIIIAFAVILGPISAVIITRRQDDARFIKERKLAIFRALIKERSNPLSVDFVTALNLIQIDFSDDKNVVAAWRSFSECRNSPVPDKDDMDAWALKIIEGNSKTDKLLFEIANVLGIRVNPFDIQTSYFPRAWNDEQKLNSEIKTLTLEVLQNKRSVSIKNTNNESEETKRDMTK